MMVLHPDRFTLSTEEEKVGLRYAGFISTFGGFHVTLYYVTILMIVLFLYSGTERHLVPDRERGLLYPEETSPESQLPALP